MATQSNVAELRPAVTKSRKKPDPTNATRQRRHRQKHKAEARAVTTPVPASEIVSTENPKEINATVTALPVPAAPAVALPVPGTHHRAAVDSAAYAAALALAGAAAYFSVKGMTVLFPGAPLAVICMSTAMEATKLVTAGWLARRWQVTAWTWRLVLVILVAGLAVINAAGVYAQLVAAHVVERGAATSAVEAQGEALVARIEVAAGRLTDLDRQISQIDAAVTAATQRGKAGAAVFIMEGHRKTRAALAGERERAAASLAGLKAERAQVAATGRRLDTESAPIVYVAQMLGVGGDSERAIRWLIALMVLCCDPLAIALTAAASSRRP